MRISSPQPIERMGLGLIAAILSQQLAELGVGQSGIADDIAHRD
jgi:hypothetical protein